MILILAGVRAQGTFKAGRAATLVTDDHFYGRLAIADPSFVFKPQCSSSGNAEGEVALLCGPAYDACLRLVSR